MLLMKDRIGEIFDASVSGVTSFGAFVALDGVYVEGWCTCPSWAMTISIRCREAPAHGRTHAPALRLETACA